MQKAQNNVTSYGGLLANSKSLLLYGGAGAVGTAVHFAVLFATLNFVGPVPASTLGAIAGCIVNYFLARHVVFSLSKPRNGAFARFVTVAVFGIAVNAVVITTLLGVLPIVLNQAVASAMVLLLGYSLNKWWTFNDRQA